MDNLARQDEAARDFGHFLHSIASVTDVAALDQMCHEYLYRESPIQGLHLASGMSWANPFFLPNIPEQAMEILSIERSEVAELVMRAKLMALQGDRVRLLISAPPLAAPDFFANALTMALGLAPADFHAAATDPRALGATTLDQEPDEFALIREGMLPGAGCVASHSGRATAYGTRLLERYGVRPIVVLRDMADIIAELDAALVAGTASAGVAALLPPTYASLDTDTRLMLLVGRFGAWIADFERSWIQVANEGIIRPLFLTYEGDFLGDRHLLARKIAEFVGPRANPLKLAAVLDERELAPAGKGAELPEQIRATLNAMSRAYHNLPG